MSNILGKVRVGRSRLTVFVEERVDLVDQVNSSFSSMTTGLTKITRTFSEILSVEPSFYFLS